MDQLREIYKRGGMQALMGTNLRTNPETRRLPQQLFNTFGSYTKALELLGVNLEEFQRLVKQKRIGQSAGKSELIRTALLTNPQMRDIELVRQFWPISRERIRQIRMELITKGLSVPASKSLRINIRQQRQTQKPATITTIPARKTREPIIKDLVRAVVQSKKILQREDFASEEEFKQARKEVIKALYKKSGK